MDAGLRRDDNRVDDLDVAAVEEEDEDDDDDDDDDDDEEDARDAGLERDFFNRTSRSLELIF